eukprot:1767875-Amphidinium_carterae.1
MKTYPELRLEVFMLLETNIGASLRAPEAAARPVPARRQRMILWTRVVCGRRRAREEKDKAREGDWIRADCVRVSKLGSRRGAATAALHHRSIRNAQQPLPQRAVNLAEHSGSDNVALSSGQSEYYGRDPQVSSQSLCTESRARQTQARPDEASADTRTIKSRKVASAFVE